MPAPDLNFAVVDAEVPAYAAVPTLIFKLRIDNQGPQENIHNVLLRCQIQFNVRRRRYSAEEQARLLEVFGEPERWRDTLRPFLWTHVNVTVPRFSDTVTVDMPVPCTYDFEVVSTKYFDALSEGDVPLTFLFSGTIFYEGVENNLQVGQIPWSKEAAYRMPIALWREMIERYYPNSAWIRMRKDVFDELYRYKARHSLPTWEAVIINLLRAGGEEEQS